MSIPQFRAQITDYSVLVVDDDETMRFVISRVVARCDCAVQTASSAPQALALLETQVIDLVFYDLSVPGAESAEVMLSGMKKRFPETTVVLMSKAHDDSKRRDLIEQGAFECLRKPFFEQECHDILTRLSNPQIEAFRNAS